MDAKTLLTFHPLFSEAPVSISGTSNLFCVLFEVGTDYTPPFCVYFSSFLPFQFSLGRQATYYVLKL